MKILHLTSSSTKTGSAAPALEIALAQRALGHDVTFAFDQKTKGDMKEKARRLRIEDALELSHHSSPIQVFRDLRTLSQVNDKYDVIHAHSSHDHSVVAFAKRRRAKLFRFMHNDRAAQRRGVQHWVYKRTDGFLFPVDAYAALFDKNYPGLRKTPKTVVPGAVDGRRFSPGDQDACRQTMNLPTDAFVFGIVARIKAGRGHDVLLEAFSLHRRNFLDSRLFLIGTGEGTEEVRRHVARLGLERSVVFAGFRDADLPQAIAACDATVLMEEGNDAGCRAVLESLACGVPVLAGRHPATEDLLTGLRSSFLFDSKDVSDVAGTLSNFADCLPRGGMHSRKKDAL